MPWCSPPAIAGTRPRRSTGASERLALVAGLFLAAHFATWVPSLSFTSVASSVALVATQPVWAALIARWRGDHVPRLAWWGIASAMAGTVVLTGVDLSISPRALFGDLLALVGGALAAAYVTVGAEARRTISTTVYATACYGVAALALLAVCGVGRQPLAGYDGRTWLLLVATVLGPQLLGPHAREPGAGDDQPGDRVGGDPVRDRRRRAAGVAGVRRGAVRPRPSRPGC